MAIFRAEQLVFVDESLFKESTGHRTTAWAPVGEPARYHDDLSRGRSWSILPAYTTDGYLDCTRVARGYVDAEMFLEWVVDELLPQCGQFPGPKSVIVMDNLGAHTALEYELRAQIEAAGC